MDELAAVAFERHRNEVLRFVRRHLADPHEAEEIAQTVFAEAAARLDPLTHQEGELLPWLYTVAQRRLIDRARRLRSAGQTTVALEESSVAAPEPEYGSEVARALRVSLERLPALQQRVVVLRLIEGRSFAEISELISASEAAARMRFMRGLTAIRDDFEREGLTP